MLGSPFGLTIALGNDLFPRAVDSPWKGSYPKHRPEEIGVIVRDIDHLRQQKTRVTGTRNTVKVTGPKQAQIRAMQVSSGKATFKKRPYESRQGRSSPPSRPHLLK